MRNRIVSTLAEIEKNHDIEILFACESGSRAWGFPSKDSDYDVRFIYIRKQECYLSVFEEPSELNFPIVDELDFVGWDIKKVFLLLSKSNVTPFEWLQSPIVYKEKEGFVLHMKSILSSFYSRKRHMHHYLGIVRGRMRDMTSDEMKLKSFFYTMRSLLSAHWSMQFDTYAPMEFAPLTKLLPDNIAVSCKELLLLKLEGNEDYKFHLSTHLASYIGEMQVQMWSYADRLESEAGWKEKANVEFLKFME